MSTYISNPPRPIRRRVPRPGLVPLALLALGLAASAPAQAQGCVAARGGVCVLPNQLGILGSGEAAPPGSGFQVFFGYRWLHSDRHFVGDHEEKHRQEEGSEVINDSHFLDPGVSYAFSPRFSASLTVPFSVHDRSQVVRSNDVSRTILQRFSTQSLGLGDLRLMANAWVLDPHKHMRGNVLLGVGVDMPTGEKDATDTFQMFDPATGQIVARERTVDQSIQPGDGGWGLLTELYAYYQLAPTFNVFVNGSYALTPEELNGVPTYRTNPYEAVMSIADSYMGRGGFQYVLWPKYGLTLSLAGRIDGVPVEDAIGGSNGFRRPGYSVSLEPGISATVGTWSFGVNAPVALYRNRERSVADRQWTEATGIYRHGDAAFADYLVMFTMSKSL